MRRTTLTLLTATLLAAAPLTLAQGAFTYFALEPLPSLEEAEAQAATLAGHPTAILTETGPVPGYEAINLRRHTYRVLYGPLTSTQLDAARATLTRAGHDIELVTLPTPARAAYQVQVGSYRSKRLAEDARAALHALGEPTFTHDSPPFTTVHAGPYATRAEAETALKRIQQTGITANPTIGTLAPEHETSLDQHQTTEPRAAAPPAPQPNEPQQADAPRREEDLPIPVPTPKPLAAPPIPTVREPAPEPPDLHTVTAEAPLLTRADPDQLSPLGVSESAPPIRGWRAELTPDALFVHVAANADPSRLTGTLAALEELGVKSDVRLGEDAYRVYVGPLTDDQAAELRAELRKRGIATFTVPDPVGESVTLPDPARDAAATADAADDEGEAHADSGVAPDETEAAHAPAWEPDLPTYRDRTQLPEGSTYYAVANSEDLQDLKPAHDTLTDTQQPMALLEAGDLKVLLAGPYRDWELSAAKQTLRRHNLATLTVHNPDHPPTHALIAEAARRAAAPANYLALEPLEGVTLDDLRAERPDLFHLRDRLLTGPIPNDEIESAAATLTRLARVAFHPYPAPPQEPTADAWVEHAYALLNHQQPAAARDAFLEARALDATHYEALFGLAVTEDLLGDEDAAEFAYQYVMNAHPERFEARFNYALRTEKVHGATAAVPHYRHALTLAQALAPEVRAEAHAALAAALTRTHDYVGAAENHQAAYHLTNDLDHLVARLKAQRAAGQSLELLPELTRLELDTRDARFTALIADVYVAAGQTAYAVDAIDRRMRDHPTDTDLTLLLNARAAVAAAAGDAAAALTDLEAAYDLNPDDPTTRHNLGLALLAQGQARAALPHLRTAVELGVTDPHARLDLAEAALAAGEHRLAAEAAAAAADTLDGAERRAALEVHAAAARHLDQHNAALASLEELLAANPNDPQLLTMAGASHYHTGQYARAAERLEAAYNITGDETVRAALVNALLASQRYADAERHLRAILAATPRDADTLHKLGWALIHQGDHQAARQAWSDAAAEGHEQATEDLESVFPQ